MNEIQIISQLPGGIKFLEKEHFIDKTMKGSTGSLGGSGFWSVRPTFFREVGFLDLKHLVGQNKRHDQLYWLKLGKNTNGKPYILGLRAKLAYHCGPIVGSVCNVLTKNRSAKNKEELIKFEYSEENIDKLSFDEFYDRITKDECVAHGW
jgi:hypothetical protein